MRGCCWRTRMHSLAAPRRVSKLPASSPRSRRTMRTRMCTRHARMLGREAEATAIVERAHARFDNTSITEYEEAMLHIAHGDVESTLQCLERHALRKANGTHCMVVDPTFGVLHHDPRWR